MELFALNEWIWADISGANGTSHISLAIQFLEAFIKSPHQIVVVSGSPFDQKAWDICRSQHSLGKRVAKLFVVQIRQDETRARIVSPSELKELPSALADQIKDDDRYLVRTLVTFPEAILVTTDTPLRSILSERNLKAISREEFLQRYFGISEGRVDLH
ncbi:MAG: hypothetical protein AB1798_06540 [Spirochaetota bacterium]